MALLSNITSLSPSLSTASAAIAYPFLRLSKITPFLSTQNGTSQADFKVQTPFVLNNRDPVFVKAFSDVDGTGPTASKSPAPPSEKLEQKMKMKMAKKIRLRRKRLVRKCHLRKKGPWSPSKLKKNKNV